MSFRYSGGWLQSGGFNPVVAPTPSSPVYTYYLYDWGNNIYGQLGLGFNGNYSSPIQVGALTTWSQIAFGFSHIIATKTDGTLWSWGNNGQGQLGLGNRTYYSSPKQVGALTTWLSISSGGTNSLGIHT